MLKATITNLNPPTNIWIWINAKELSSGKLNLLLTFHATKEDAQKDQEKNSNTYLGSASMIPANFAIEMPVSFIDLDGLRLAVSKSAVDYINSLGLTNISSLTIEL